MTSDINQRSHVDSFHNGHVSEPQRDGCYHPIMQAGWGEGGGAKQEVIHIEQCVTVSRLDSVVT